MSPESGFGYSNPRWTNCSLTPLSRISYLPVHAIIPLSLLEALRNLDTPVEDGLEELAGEIVSKRLGLSATVAAQINRYQDAAKKDGRVATDEAIAVFRLASRRPDAQLVFADAGRRAARYAARSSALPARALAQASKDGSDSLDTTSPDAQREPIKVTPDPQARVEISTDPQSELAQKAETKDPTDRVPAARPPAGLPRPSVQRNPQQRLLWAILGLIVGFILGYVLHTPG